MSVLMLFFLFLIFFIFFFFSSRRRHTRLVSDWSSECALPISLEGFTGQLHLLFPIEEGDPADLVEVEIETFPAFIDCTGDLRWSYRPTLATCLDCHATSLLRDAGPLLGEQPRLRAEPNLKSANILPKMREINTLGKL